MSRSDYIARAVNHLRQARDWLRAAGAPHALAQVRKALASAESAHRHSVHKEEP